MYLPEMCVHVTIRETANWCRRSILSCTSMYFTNVSLIYDSANEQLIHLITDLTLVQIFSHIYRTVFRLGKDNDFTLGEYVLSCMLIIT